jgi:hypothetical protein
MDNIYLIGLTAEDVDAQVNTQTNTVDLLFDLDMFDNRVTPYIDLSFCQPIVLLYLSLFNVRLWNMYSRM